MVVASPPSTVLPAGWSGLYALKYCLEEGLSATAFEERPEPYGGVEDGGASGSGSQFLEVVDASLGCPFPCRNG